MRRRIPSCKLKESNGKGVWGMRLYVTKEVHELGGPGLFLLGRAEEQLARLLEEYRGKVQLIYLDPPFGTGDTFSMKGADGGKRSLCLPMI